MDDRTPALDQAIRIRSHDQDALPDEVLLGTLEEGDFVEITYVALRTDDGRLHGVMPRSAWEASLQGRLVQSRAIEQDLRAKLAVQVFPHRTPHAPCAVDESCPTADQNAARHTPKAAAATNTVVRVAVPEQPTGDEVCALLDQGICPIEGAQLAPGRSVMMHLLRAHNVRGIANLRDGTVTVAMVRAAPQSKLP